MPTLRERLNIPASVPREIPELDDEESLSDYEGGGGGSQRRLLTQNGGQRDGNLESAQSENSVDLRNELENDVMMGAGHPINQTDIEIASAIMNLHPSTGRDILDRIPHHSPHVVFDDSPLSYLSEGHG